MYVVVAILGVEYCTIWSVSDVPEPKVRVSVSLMPGAESSLYSVARQVLERAKVTPDIEYYEEFKAVPVGVLTEVKVLRSIRYVTD